MNRTITIVICLLLSLALGVFLVWPRYQEFKIKKVDVLKKEAELQNLKEYLSEINLLSQEIEKYSTEISKIETALPSRFSLPSLINYLQKTTFENGLILKSYNLTLAVPNLPEQESGLKEFSLTLDFSGSYSAFRDFLLVLEKSSRLIEVENISFSSPEKEKPYDFNLGIKVHSY